MSSCQMYKNQLSLASLLVIIPLLLFPNGIFPFIALGLALMMQVWHWAVSGKVQIRHEDVPLLIVLGMALLGYSISVDRVLSWPRLCSIFLGLLIFFELRRSLKSSQWETWIAVGLCLAGLGVAGISLVGTDWDQVRLFDLPWIYDRLPTLIRGLPHSGALQNYGDLFGPRWVGITMGMIAPIYLPMLSWRERPWVQWLAGGVFMLVTLTLLLTQTLQGLLGFLAGSFIVLLFVNRWFLLFVPFLGVSVAGLVAWLGIDKVAEVLLSIDNAVGIAVVLRLDMWSRAVAMIRDMPFTGIGLNTYPLIQSQFYPGIYIGPEAHSHNLYLQLALDLGLPGLVAFLWFLTVWLTKVLKGFKQEASVNKRLLLIGVIAGVVSYLGHGLIDAMMLGAKPTFMLWIILGIGAALTTSRTRMSNPKFYQWVFVCLAMPLLMGSIAFWKPSKIYINLGTVQAHKLLSPFPEAKFFNQDAVKNAKVNLENAIRLDSTLRQAYLLLARIESAQGNFLLAERHYDKRVALDMQDPISTYNPAQQLWLMISPVTSSDPETELQRVYQKWNHRFPIRAEGYLLRSILARQYQADPASAKAILEAGIKSEAQPIGLLEYMLGKN